MRVPHEIDQKGRCPVRQINSAHDGKAGAVSPQLARHGRIQNRENQAGLSDAKDATKSDNA
jgi:hypothetical protein